MNATATSTSVRRLSPAARRRRWRRWSTRAALGGMVVLTLIGGGGYIALETQVLGVKSVHVSGARAVSSSAVLSAAHVPVGTPMARLDRGAVRARVLEALPGIATVSVEREWPTTVRLVVTERSAAAAVPQAGHYLIVDRTGVVFRTAATIPTGLVTLVVRSPYSVDEATSAGLSVLGSLPPDLLTLVARVEAASAEEVVLVLRDKRQVVWGGPRDAPAKVAVLQVLLKRAGRVIDVSAPGLATVR